MNDIEKLTRLKKFKRWLLSRKILKRMGCSVVVLITITVLFYQIERWRGARAWESSKKEYLEAGGTLEIRDLFPELPSTESNFGALPIFKDITSEQSSLGKENRRKLGEATLSSPQDTKRPRKSEDKEKYLREYAAYLGLDIEEQSSSQVASELLAFIDQKAGHILQQFDASRDLSESQFCNWSFSEDKDELWLATSMPHVMELLSVFRTIHLKGLASIENGNSKKAFDSLVLTLRFRDLAKDHFLIGLLVADTMQKNILDLVQYGIEKNIWADEDLIWISESIGRPSLGKAFVAVMKMEALAILQAADFMKHKIDRRTELEVMISPFGAKIWSMIPKGWYDLNKAKMLSLTLPLLELDPLDINMRDFLKVIRTNEQEIEAMNESFSPSSILVKMSPSISRYGKRVVIHELQRELMRASCAIERFNLTHDRLPKTLSELVPEYLSVTPLDPVDQAPLRYQLRGQSSYTLYSVGIDEEDNGGTPPKKTRDPVDGTDVVWRVR